MRNLKYAVRSLRKSPAFSATVILTLALGIGANGALFSAINSILLRPLPFPNGDQLVSLAQSHPKAPLQFLAPTRLEDWNRLNNSFQAITGYYTEDVSELSSELPEKLKRALVAPRFLQVWGIAPELGRDFTPDEERFGGPGAVLISDRLWRARFGSSPDALGKTLRIGRASYPIVGIMPASFLFPDRDVDLWSPSPMDAPYAQSRESTWFIVIGRLKPGMSLAQARADLATVQANLGRQYPKTDALLTPDLQLLKETTVGGVRRSLWILFGAVSVLLLIACTNIAALLLSRAARRKHEISIRFSLGASRRSVAMQLFGEVLVLAFTGGALGLFLAAVSGPVLRSLARDLPRIEEIGLDWRILLYTAVCVLAVTLLCGILPAIRGTRQSLTESLAQSSRTYTSGRSPVQFVLVGIQVALAVTLLCGAGLLIRSFQELGRVAPGFDPQRVLAFHISTSWGETADRNDARQRVQTILDGLRTIPGVEQAATALSLPGVPTGYQLEFQTVPAQAESEPKILAESRWVSPSYFATMRIPLLAGEMCRDDSKTGGMVVNRSFANTYLRGSNVVGRILSQPANVYVRPAEIRGIVGDARETGLDREPPPVAYHCSAAMQPNTLFLVRTSGEPAAMPGTIRRKIQELEPRRSVFALTPVADRISGAYAQNRLRTILLACFALSAVSLAWIGLFGTLSYLVSVRQREIGLRLALGALRGQIVRHFLSQGLRVSLAGCLAGLLLAKLSTRLLSGMLYGVSTSDAVTIGGVIATILAVSVLASIVPALRAARLDALEVLREE